MKVLIAKNLKLVDLIIEVLDARIYFKVKIYCHKIFFYGSFTLSKIQWQYKNAGTNRRKY